MKKNGLDILPFLYQFMMVFGFVSKMRLGPFTSLRLTLLIALIVIIFKWNEVISLLKGLNLHKLRMSLFLLFGCLLITLFHSMESHSSLYEYFEPTEVIIIVIGILIVGLWAGVTFKSFERFAWVLVAVGVVQSISVFESAVNPGFKSFIEEHFLYEGFADKVSTASLDDLARSPGIGIAWSSGSLVLAYCCFALVALKIESKISMLWFSMLFAIIAGATALVGRSGLLVEIGLLIFFGLSTGKVKNILTLLLVAIVGLIVFNQVMSLLDNFVAESTQRWILAFMDSDKVSHTNEGVLKGGFPEFSSLFIFGTGVEYGQYNGQAFYADSGYIKSYTSIGIVGMVCYYIGILYFIISTFPKHMPRMRKFFLWVAIAAIYIMEYKEPFIGMFVYTWVIFVMGLLWNKEQRTLINENTNCRGLRPEKQIVTIG